MRIGAKFLPVAIVVQLSCSAALEQPPDAGEADGGADVDGEPSDMLQLVAGIYEGAADNETRAHLGLWKDGTTHSGVLVVGDSRGFALTFGPLGPRLTAIDGACNGCGGPWQPRVTSAPTGRLTMDVTTSSRSPGFSRAVLSPHSGFLPASLPAPYLEIWAGPVVAVDPAADSPILDAVCEVSVTSAETIHSFECGAGSASAWTDQRRDSWSVTAAGVSWSTVGGLEFRAEPLAEGQSLIGTVRRDGGPIGSFHLTRQAR